MRPIQPSLLAHRPNVFLSVSAFEPAPVLTVQYLTDQRIAELESSGPSLAPVPSQVTPKQSLFKPKLIEYPAAESRLHFHLQDQGVQARLIRDMRFMYEESEETDEVLLDQAYAMNLHVNDLVARRRLVQMMESSLRAVGEHQPLSEQPFAINTRTNKRSTQSRALHVYPGLYPGIRIGKTPSNERKRYSKPSVTGPVNQMRPSASGTHLLAGTDSSINRSRN